MSPATKALLINSVVVFGVVILALQANDQINKMKGAKTA